DRVRRREYLSGGDRTRAAGASGGRGSSGDRRGRRALAGGADCYRGAARWRIRRGGRTARFPAVAARALPSAAGDRVRRRIAAQRPWQDSTLPPARAVRRVTATYDGRPLI